MKIITILTVLIIVLATAEQYYTHKFNQESNAHKQKMAKIYEGEL
jgi:uncharacterized protein YpmB